MSENLYRLSDQSLANNLSHGLVRLLEGRSDHFPKNHVIFLGSTNQAADGGTKTRLIVEDKDFGPLDTSEPDDDYFELFLDKVRGEGELPFDDETAMHPTIAIVNAKKNEGIWRSKKND